MVITTNYSKSDWKREIPRIAIICIPVIFLLCAVYYLYIPYLENWTTFLKFETEDEMIVRFINYILSDNELQSGLFTPDGWLIFFLLMWGGGAIFPLLIILKFYSLIPTNYIIKKLRIEPRMKLVIFVNGKPITRLRDLFENE